MSKAATAALVVLVASISCPVLPQDSNPANPKPSAVQNTTTGAGSNDLQQPSAQPEEKVVVQDAGKTDKQEARKTSEDKDEEKDSGHKTHVRLGTIGIGFSYTHFPNRFFDPFFGYGFYPYYGFYSPFFYDPFYGPYVYPGYLPSLDYGMGKGELKLSGAAKDAKVYIDGAYAGEARKLKNMWLDPGAYNISVKASDGRTFQQRVYVLSGKKLELRAELTSQKDTTEEKK